MTRISAFFFTLFSLSAGARETDTLSAAYVALALQGDVSHAGELFEKLKPTPGSGAEFQLAERYRHRFILRDEETPADSGSAFIDQLLSTYRAYWTRSMMGELPPEAGSEWLDNQLYKLLEYYNDKELSEKSLDLISTLKEAIDELGFHSDFSFSSPWRDLVLWKTEQRQRYLIELTDRKQPVDVVFMDDFHSLGWSEFATLGMTSTGGWAKKNLLYCVSWAWDPTSENFQVSFLKHEGRHVADFEQFPQLHAIDLEYRAKLTELAFASSTLPRILKKFTDNGSDNPDSPHAYANYRVSRDLYRTLIGRELPESGNPWLLTSADKINPVARALLDKHTELLENEGARVTSGVVHRQ